MVSIANPDETGMGDILVSIPDDRVISVKDYRVGDVGRVYEKLCPCGEKRTLEVLGRRGHDYIKLAGAILRQEEFDRVVRLLGVWDDYRAEASDFVEDGKHKGKVILRVYQQRERGTDVFERELADRFSRELFLTPTQTLADLVRKDLFMPLEIVYVKKAFPKRHKDAKLVQVNG